MTESLFDKYLEPDVQANLRRIAAGVFARHSVDFGTARRAGGWSNAVWLAGGLVLRLAVQPGSDRLRREAQIAALLPPETGYPTIVDSGETGGHEWLLSREIAGAPLGEAWEMLSPAEQKNALRQLWARACAAHTVRAADARGIARERAWYNSNDADYADGAIGQLAAQNILTPPQAQTLRGALRRFWAALPAAAAVLNHGDLTLDNALYHAGEVSALLDFEFAVLAPVELDLNSLVKFAYAPRRRSPLRTLVAELAAPILASPGSGERLRGYAILLELWQMENWLAHPEGEGPLETWDPYRRLLSLARGDGGYLAPLLG